MITYDVLPKTRIIPLGRQGENNVRQIIFKASYLKSKVADGGEFVLLHQRNGDAQPYPVSIAEESGYIIWTVTNADNANSGLGECELQYIVDDAVVKTKIWKTRVAESLEESGDVPDPESGWVADLLKKISESTGTGDGLPDASECEDGTILVTQSGDWALLHIGLDDITEEAF